MAAKLPVKEICENNGTRHCIKQKFRCDNFHQKYYRRYHSKLHKFDCQHTHTIE